MPYPDKNMGGVFSLCQLFFDDVILSEVTEGNAVEGPAPQVR